LLVEEHDAPRPADPRVPDDWFVGFHRGLAARFWRAAGATMADEDARLVRELLDLAPGTTVLDVPCGDGRIALRLGAAGHAVIGIDLAVGELEGARALAARDGMQARFVVGDLRTLPDVGLVDGVVSWGNRERVRLRGHGRTRRDGSRRAPRPHER
jgi:cyclopropane fatty-acyl-phospholipid synthase-like methyltransferase